MTWKNYSKRLMIMMHRFAEARNHHPDLYLHDNKKLTITLHTHNVMAITKKDYNLANAIDNIWKQWYL